MSGSCLCGVDSEDAERDNVTAARSALRAPSCAFHRSTSRHTPILALAPRRLPEFAVNTFHSFHTRTLLLTTLRTLRYPKRPSPSNRNTTPRSALVALASFPPSSCASYGVQRLAPWLFAPARRRRTAPRIPSTEALPPVRFSSGLTEGVLGSRVEVLGSGA